MPSALTARSRSIDLERGRSGGEFIRQGSVRMETDDDRLAVTFSYILIWTREWLVDDEFRCDAEDLCGHPRRSR